MDSSSRVVPWTALAVFSAVALTAHETDDNNNNDTESNWVTAVTAISMSLAFCAIVANFVATEKFVGQPVETGMAFLLLIFWAAGLPVVMNPNNGLATATFGVVNGTGIITISNTNLYFSSWGAFCANLYIMAGLARDANVADVSTTPPKTAGWFGIFAASFIVMVSSSRYFRTFCDDTDQTGVEDETCRRTEYAIGVGTIGTVATLVMSFLSAKDIVGNTVELGVSLLLVALYCFGVGFTTFKSGPGTTIGNLYFSTWTGFLICLGLLASCLREQFGDTPAAQPTPAASGATAPTQTDKV